MDVLKFETFNDLFCLFFQDSLLFQNKAKIVLLKITGITKLDSFESYILIQYNILNMNILNMLLSNFKKFLSPRWNSPTFASPYHESFPHRRLQIALKFGENFEVR